MNGLEELEPLLPSSAPSISTGPFFPFLHSGDLLEVEHLGCEISRGDVIYFRSPDNERMIVHRVVDITAAGVQTRGDNNPSDNPASANGRKKYGVYSP